ncbi:Putative Acyl transferase domain superfamily, phosphopantetheine binding ACP domain, thiolase [Colletotrichum destructivum]|uniref:Acyl transferase domain superfamily, phosphopantetheine binding ACP domain, thiolase n=1 Tax=Colletotrichum destructivum TaxID=34406 RepID=A0AAX4ID25_9PEZI|nr:Putative Acyl transferase domain superfamily, phosphopantetheine binding ACP domain, thiolase [Colletotrichum destructivum]
MAPGIISSTNGDESDDSLVVLDNSPMSVGNGNHHNNGITNATSNGPDGNGAPNSNNDQIDGPISTNGHMNGRDGPDTSPTSPDAAIAICGMACRLPGGLHTPQQLWEFLLAKGDAKSVVPESRYNVDAFYDPSGRPGTVKTRHGYFLDADLTKVDGAFSSFVRGSLERMDPHHIQMMEVARECLEDAGVTGWRGGLIGCYVGSFGEDWIEMNAKENQPYGVYRTTGSGDFMLSNHVSYELDLKGPSMTIRTACSAAMVALHEACRAIRRGDCESAIVGGANLILAPGMTQAMSEQGVLSPEGSCKTFSADADGYGRGEAVSALFIKPLDAALRDGNPVRAIIKQTATNADGKTQGVSMPSTESHEALIRKAYELANIEDFSKTTFVECHGTGTPTGDPIETNAVARVFGSRERQLFIGSVKPNLGHSEGASGLTSLIKVVMALENRVIPPNIKFSRPNPNIPFKESNLVVPVDATPWPKEAYERASINSFGIGGTNAHAILDSARSYGVEKDPRPSSSLSSLSSSSSSSSSMIQQQQQQETLNADDEPQLLLYSANSSSSLKKTVENFQPFVENNPDKLAQLAYTLANGREHLAHRAFAMVTRGGDPVVSPFVRAPQPQQSPDVVMVFTGQGAQWPAMGAELLRQNNSVFQSTIRSLDAALDKALLTKPEWSLERELLKVGKQSRMELAEVSQPLCAAVQIALVNTLASVGVRPIAVVGHSSGEIGGAYAAGALTAREAIVVAWLRGVAAKRQQRTGSMAAVGLGWDEVKPYLAGTKAVVACENSPHSVTISGDSPAVEAVLAKIKQSPPPGGKDVLARLLKIDKAYHSYHMAEVGDWYRAALEEHHVVGDGAARNNCLFYSSVSGKLLRPGDSLGPGYWKRNLESPVLFSTAVSQMLQNPELSKPNRAVFLEVGPHSAMAGPLRQIMAKVLPPPVASLPYVSAMVRGRNCIESYLTAVGKLHQVNVSIDLRALLPRDGSKPFLADLPRYAWDHEETAWWESRTSKEWRSRKHPYHELLGVRTTESTDLEPAWRNVFHIEQSPWVRDHVIAEDVVFPFAGYMAMAAEAARQATGVEDGYALRHVIVSTALVVTDGKPLELLTTLRPRRLTDSLDSQWWEFSIASHNGALWTKHCTGQVRSLSRGVDGGGIPPSCGDDARHSMTRTLGTRKAYNIMQEVGLRYGPFFQALQNIKTGTLDRSAAAAVRVPELEGGAAQQPYHLHPIMLDACLQILSVAATRGYTKRLDMVIPTLVEELEVYRSTSAVELLSEAQVNSLGAITGSARCFADGQVVLRMAGARLAPLPGQSAAGGAKDTHSTARYTWSPHVDFLDERSLIDTPAAEDRELYLPVLDEMTQLSLVYADRRLAPLRTEVPFMAKYGSWIREQASRADAALVEMEDWALFEAVKSRLHSLHDTAAAGAALAIFKILSSITGIFQGRDSASNVLLADDSLAKVRILRDRAFDTSRLLCQLAFSRPDLRVLELEAGMGTQTAEALGSLALETGGPVMYSAYTFTDLSSGVVTAAKERFKAAANMQYKTLDISQPLEEQGFAGDNDDDGYDVIIATNVMHTTPTLSDSLSNLRRLLRPNGRVILQEFSAGSSKWLNFIMGAMPRWWSGVTDGRVDAPYMDLASWGSALSAAGLAVSASMPDAERETLRQNSMMIVRHADFVAKSPSGREVTLLCRTGSEEPDVVERLKRELAQAGYVVNQRTLGDEIPQGEDVVALLDEQDAFFDGIDEERYVAFKSLVRAASAGGSGIFWITRLCQVPPFESPSHAQVLGTARTIRSEAAVAFATCEVDDTSASAGSIAAVFRQFQTAREAKPATATDDAMTLDPDYEYAIVDNVVHAGRFCPFSIADELRCADARDRIVLDKGKPGLAMALSWNRRVPVPLVQNLVEVKVSAAGLNFRDVLSANGIVDMPEEGFGLEASGVVSAVGPEVQHLRPGDRVFLFSRGSFATSVTVPEELCEKIPESMSLEDAATMPCVYATAIYSLFNIGRLQRGQSILIHSACGGVGIAAIQLARMAGAVIYTTVGSEEKIRYLMDTFEIPRHHIFNSRDASFVEGIKSVTLGKGVDLALNSLSGELLHATWGCIAEFGTMVEIGKRDLLGSGKLEMAVFLANRSYCCVDLDQLCFKRRAVCKELLQRVVECYNDGYIQPVRPVTVFDAGKVREAFRFMQQGLHMGKIVIKIRDTPGADPEADLMTATRTREVSLGGGGGEEEDGSYLLVGGLGGLGQAVSRWLVERGARNLVYLSRSAGSGDEDQCFAEELRSMGARVTLVQGDVCQGADVRRAVEAAGGSNRLRGVLQMSMVLRDRAWDGMTLEDWQQAVAPKVQGTWNLHLATQSCAALDFFVLFSSISGIVGQPGQANYAAANTFLDSFARWRRSQGLPASAVDIGAVEDIGVISNNETLRRAMKTTGAYMINEVELLEALGASVLLKDGAVTGTSFVLGLASTTPLTSASNRSLWKKDMRMAVYRNITANEAGSGGVSSSSEALKTWLGLARGGDEELLKDPEAVGFLAHEIGKKLFTLVLRPEEEIQTSVALADLGMDSLVAIEMRTWWRVTFGSNISMLELLGMGNLEALAAHAIEGMLKALQGKT